MKTPLDILAQHLDLMERQTEQNPESPERWQTRIETILEVKRTLTTIACFLEEIKGVTENN